jgi:SAM-dependent methyltransferase
MSGYYSSVNEDLLAFMPPDSKRVLEVGCGTGALASRFKLINPKCEYWGVEANHKASLEAYENNALDKLYCDTIEGAGDMIHRAVRVEGKSIDCFVFGDVLEHLLDPLAVLKRCVDLLEPNGSVVACVPNVQHWTVIKTLLDGRWPQEDQGLFDRTHLRWFTKQSLIEMFEGAGLSIAKIVPRRLIPSGHERLVDAVHEFGLVEDVARFTEGVTAYQWIVHAVKGEVPSRKVLVRGFPAEACCARPRLTEPGRFLNTIPGFRYSEVPTQVESGESVVVVRQRFNISEDDVRRHLKDGCLIVGEWDDDPWYEGFRSKLKAPSVEWALKACHAVTVSTEAIAELVRPINPNVAVFPNQIAAVGPKREYVESDVLRIFMGGQRSRDDWSEAVEAVNAVVAENPERYHFVVVHDRDLYEALETKYKTFYAFQPYEKYRALLRSCDVAVSPLADTRFNRCKSDIRFIECCSESMLCIDFGDYPEPSIDWSKQFFFKAGCEHRAMTLNNRMLCDHYKRRSDQYNEWLGQKPELERQLFERLPELKETMK